MADYSSYQAVTVRREGDIFVLTLNNPERLNAFTAQMHHELLELLQLIDEDPDCRAGIITGAGRGFCAGGDYRGFGTNLSERRHLRAREAPHKFTDIMLDMETPMIAMVNGPAVGQGLITALYCDIVVAANDARLGDRHINFGLVPGDGGAVMLPLLLPMNKAKELLLTGRLLSGAEAAALGLVNYAVDRDDLWEFTLALAREVAAQPTYAQKATKSILNNLIKRRSLDVFDLSHAYEILSTHDPEHPAAVKAFAERRPLRPAGS